MCVTSTVGSGAISPFACSTPEAIEAVMLVPALPMSIWPHAMLKRRPSRDEDLVRPVIACFVAVYGAECGRGTCAEIDPLLMIRPPCGCWSLIMTKACCVHRKAQGGRII